MGRRSRVVLLGAAGSGKTSLVRRMVGLPQLSTYEPTIEDVHRTVTYANGSKEELEILDTSGKEQINNMSRLYIEAADAFIVTYSVGNIDSFSTAIQILQDISAVRGFQVPRILVACKCDSDYREVSSERGYSVANQFGCSFSETSAIVNVSVVETVYDLVSQLQFSRLRQRRQTQPKCCFL